MPETRFARSGDLSIAYQVLGEGDVDVILVPQWLSNIEQYWDSAAASYFLRRIASFSRLIMFDKRGTGLSDAVPTTQTLEERMDDVLAVMDAAAPSGRCCSAPRREDRWPRCSPPRIPSAASA